MASVNSHEFYCIHCGNKGIPIPRKSGQLHAKGHYKNLYCIHCKNTTRHLEIRHDYEVIQFKQNYEEGKYVEDAKNDNFNDRMSWVWENNIR